MSKNDESLSFVYWLLLTAYCILFTARGFSMYDLIYIYEFSASSPAKAIGSQRGWEKGWR
jgi:hypothetical protein